MAKGGENLLNQNLVAVTLIYLGIHSRPSYLPQARHFRDIQVGEMVLAERRSHLQCVQRAAGDELSLFPRDVLTSNYKSIHANVRQLIRI